jgi:hypothetical protein
VLRGPFRPRNTHRLPAGAHRTGPTLATVIRRLAALVAATGVVLLPSIARAQEDPAPPGRQPLVDVPVGCPVQPLPDVVFVGTVVDSDYRTVRFNIDQARAGDIGQFASRGRVDVRYGIDAKYLDEGDQYLIGALYDPNIQSLRSRVQPMTPTLGGDEIIGATETELECPEVVDPMRTMHTDGSSIDSGVLSPFFGNRDGLLRSLLGSVAIVCLAVFALAAVRWFLTGFGRGVESLARTSSQTREARSVMRDPEPAAAGPSRRVRQPRPR